MADDLVVSGIHLDASDTLREIRRLDRRLRRLDSEINDTARSSRRAERGFRSMAGAVAGAAAAFGAFQAAQRTARFIFRTNVEFQKLEATLKTVTGSAENAESAFQMILEFAKTTPFQITELVDAFNQLRVRGVDPTTERLRGLGNFAAAFTEDFGRLTNAIVSGAAGVTRSLRRSFGLDIRKDGEELNVVFEDMERTIPATADALSELLAEIGNTRFVDAMSERMDSLDGKISNLQDVAEIAAKSVGEEGLNEAIQDLVGTLEDAIEENEEFARSLGESMAKGVRVADGAIQLLVRHTEAIIRAMEVLAGITAGRVFASMAVSIGRAASAGRGLAGVLSVLGGPAGLGFGAAGALAALALEAHGAEADTEMLRERVDELTDSLEELTDAQIRSKMADIRGELADTVAQMSELRPEALTGATPGEAASGVMDRIRRMTGAVGATLPGPAGGFLSLLAPGVSRDIGRMDELGNKADVLRETLGELRNALVDVGEAQDDGDDSAGASAAAHAEKIDQLLASLRQERDELQFTREELVARKLEELGASEATIAQAEAILEKIDALEAEQQAQEEAREAEERRIEQALKAMAEQREATRQMREEATRQVQEFQSNLQLARIQEEIRRTERAAQAMSEALVDPLVAFVTQTESALEAVERMVTGILEQMARLTLERTLGRFLSDALTSALGGGVPDAPGPVEVAPPDLGDTTSGGVVPGLQHGGSFEVPGRGNTDTKLVRFMATPGERVTVEPKGGRGRREATNVNSKVEVNVVANDTRGFDRLLESRQALLVQLVRRGIREGL